MSDTARTFYFNCKLAHRTSILKNSVYPLGKICNTSSIWEEGKFISRKSSWWEELEGCFHKHFLMLGQSHLEKLLDNKLKHIGSPARRGAEAVDIETDGNGCATTLSSGEIIRSKYVIGADAYQSFVRNHFNIPFHIVRPQIVWAVIDGIIDTDFPKVPEIIVFQAETSDVAWIPREGKIDRFYVRMDALDFTFEDAVEKINRAVHPHSLRFKEIEWYSRFSVKESVAENFFIADRIFLAGDACHVHSVNGGQGLNTGLADAFNLIWKLSMVEKYGAAKHLLKSYELERKPVAQSVIESSGELVRSTKFSQNGTHAKDYLEIVQKRAGNITGMGIRYGTDGIKGSRLFDFEVFLESNKARIYSLLNYAKFTLLVFGDKKIDIVLPRWVRLMQIHDRKIKGEFWAEKSPYSDRAILVRPDAYIQSWSVLDNIASIFEEPIQ